MQKPSPNDGIARASENLHNHAQSLRVKAWRLIQENNHAEAQQLLVLADSADRSLMWICAKAESVWKRQ